MSWHGLPRSGETTAAQGAPAVSALRRTLAGSAEESTEILKAGTARSPWKGDGIKSSVWKTEPARVCGWSAADFCIQEPDGGGSQLRRSSQ